MYFCRPILRMWRNGSRARLRIWWRKPWGFESPHPHFFRIIRELCAVASGYTIVYIVYDLDFFVKNKGI